MVDGITAANGPAVPPYRNAGALVIGNNTTFSGNLTVEGNFTFGDAITDALSVTGTFAQTYSGTNDGHTVAGTGNLTAGKDLVRFSTTGSISSTSNVVAIEQTTGAGTAGANCLYINATGTNVEAIKVDAGTVTFDESLTIGSGGITITDGDLVVTSGKIDMNSTTAGDNFAIAAFGDGSGLELDDSNLKAIEIYPELPSGGAALSGGNVAYGIRNRFLVNLAQTNNVSLYATQGQMRVKANLAAGVHAGLYGYFEQSGTVTLSSSGAFNAACNLGVEGDASLTVDSGVNLSGCVITSNLNTGGTYNGNLYGIMVRSGSSKQPWAVAMHVAEATKGLVCDNAATQRAIDIQVTPTTADRQLYMSIDYGSTTKEAAYIIASCANNSGEVVAIRGRAQQQHDSASGGEARGVYGQGIAIASKWAGTATGIQGNAIAKNASTVTTLRGGFFEAESENTPTAITNLYGVHTRVKTTVAPGTDFINTLLETEKFGSGVAMDSFLRFKTTTWTGGETVATDVISTASLTGTVTNIIDYSGPTCTSVLYSSNTATNFLETSADSKGGAGATRATPNQTATCDGSLVVKVGAKTLLAPLYNAVTIS